MPSTNLPHSDSPSLALVHPTEAEIEHQHALNAVMWRGALSTEAYFKREVFLRTKGIAQNDGITYWALVDTSLPSDQRTVLCGCETLRKKALVARNGYVKPVLSHGIGSVFCPKEHRGRGYAQRMLTELGKTLKTWQTTSDSQVGFSILYSDIGPNFYSKLGWRVFASTHISLPGTSPTPSLLNLLPTATPLQAHDLPSLCVLDEQQLRSSLNSQTSSANPTVALVPDIATISWHHAREEFVGREIHGRIPTAKGAVVSLPHGQRAWCYWTRMWYNNDPTQSKDNTLHILRLVIEDKLEEKEKDASIGVTTNGINGAEKPVNGTDESVDPTVLAVQALLLAAQEQAAEWNMETVELWNPSSTAVHAARRIQEDVRIVERLEESIASLMWYGEEGEAEKVEWMGNEKYGWC